MEVAESMSTRYKHPVLAPRAEPQLKHTLTKEQTVHITLHNEASKARAKLVSLCCTRFTMKIKKREQLND
jgi:hypothetical protein